VKRQLSDFDLMLILLVFALVLGALLLLLGGR